MQAHRLARFDKPSGGGTYKEQVNLCTFKVFCSEEDSLILGINSIVRGCDFVPGWDSGQWACMFH